MGEARRPHNIEVTLDSYERGTEEYLRNSSAVPHPSAAAFRERVRALLVPGDRMLELGSGPGADAAFFAAAGIAVQRSDGAAAFVRRLRAEGHAAKILDLTRDELGEHWDAIYANAVLLHLTPPQLDDVLMRMAQAVSPAGLLAFTVKEGDGEAWSVEKLHTPRYFRYWRAQHLRDLLETTGWKLDSIEHAEGRLEPWLQVICRPRRP